VKVSALPIAKLGSNGEHIAGTADTKAGLVGETDGEVQGAVINSVGNEVHHLAVDFGIFPAQPCLPLLAACFQAALQYLQIRFGNN